MSQSGEAFWAYGGTQDWGVFRWLWVWALLRRKGRKTKQKLCVWILWCSRAAVCWVGCFVYVMKVFLFQITTERKLFSTLQKQQEAYSNSCIWLWAAGPLFWRNLSSVDLGHLEYNFPAYNPCFWNKSSCVYSGVINFDWPHHPAFPAPLLDHCSAPFAEHRESFSLWGHFLEQAWFGKPFLSQIGWEDVMRNKIL